MARYLVLLCSATALCNAAALAVKAQTQAPPAPLVDRVGFPENYQTEYVPLFWFDRPDNGQIRIVYGNDKAASVRAPENADKPYPYGSILVMETWSSQRGPGNVILRDAANGHFLRNQLTTIFVMRKEQGFGEAYGPNRNGEWEYVAYLPNRAYQTEPRNSFSCAQCHLSATAARDWVFRPYLVEEGGAATGVVPDVVMKHYALIPSTLRVKLGTVVTWLNDDEFDHRLGVTGEGGFEAPNIAEGRSFQTRFNRAGTFEVACRIHPGMRSTVIVEP